MPTIPTEFFSPHGNGPFPTADWHAITSYISGAPQPDRPRLWHSATLHWSELCQNVLNRFVDHVALQLPYSIGQSEHFIVLDRALPGAETRSPLFGEFVLRHILPFLAPIAIVPPFPIVGIFIHDVPTFDMYLGAMGHNNSLLPGGSYLVGKAFPPHLIVLNTLDLLNLRVTFGHEIIHALIHHLGIPLWLEEGICHHLQADALRVHNLVYETERSAERNAHWHIHGLESFWKGTCFNNVGAPAYLLAGRMVRQLLQAGPEKFFQFVRNAKPEDAGAAASVEIFGRSLKSFASEFIGQIPTTLGPRPRDTPS
jgi:hypothetical protein